MPAGIGGFVAGVGQATAVLRTMAGAAEETASRVESANERIQAAADVVLDRTDRLQSEADTKIASLLERVGEFDTQWTADIQGALELLRDGSLELDEFLLQWGEVRIATEEGNKRLRELLDGIDPRAFERRAQEIRQAIEDGSLDVQGALEELGRAQNEYSDKLAEILRKLQDGQATISQVLAVARQVQQALGDDSIGGTIAGGIQELLRNLNDGGSG